MGTSRRSSAVGTGIGSESERESRFSKSGRAEPDYKSNGHSDDNKDASALKKIAVKKTNLAKATSDKTLKSSKGNGRAENPKIQAPGSGAVKTDVKDDSGDSTASESAVQSKEAKKVSAEAVANGKGDAAPPANESFASYATNENTSSGATNGTAENTIHVANGITENSDGSVATSEKVNRTAAVSEDVKEKVVKAKREKLKASTPILSSAAKREAASKHAAKSTTDVVSNVGDVAVSS